MTSNIEILEQWKKEPAPLLPILHAFHERDGSLTEDSLRDIADGLKIPLAELYGTITFYHHFSRDMMGRERPRVCMGPVCALKDGAVLLDELKADSPKTMACAGRCDDPIPVLMGDEICTGKAGQDLDLKPSALPVANPGGLEECGFEKIREPERATIQGYKKTGGFVALRMALRKSSPQDVIDTITASGLAGRGGAGFPTGRKWQAVADAPGAPKTIVCNADEGEPGCFKDRALLDYDPFNIIEGMTIAALATGATRGFIYLRYEYPQTQYLLENAIQEAEALGYLGQNILGRGLDFKLYVRRGAGAYICGEEGSLLNSLEGKHPFPRNRPPFPVTHGFEDLPTVVNNVETLAAIAPILVHGADWYQNLGVGDNAGTKIISLSGDIQRPGNYEVPIGIPLKTVLYDWAGGPLADREIKAVTMAGLSGGFLAGEDLNVTLDEPCIRSKGSFLGAGGIIVYDDSRSMVQAAEAAMSFFAEESCGKCFPCRIGTQRLTERLEEKKTSLSPEGWHAEVNDLCSTMQATSACGLGIAAPLIVKSLVHYFPDEVDLHLGLDNEMNPEEES